MNTFLERDKLPEITQKGNNLIALYLLKKLNILNLKLIILHKENSRPDGFPEKFYI